MPRRHPAHGRRNSAGSISSSSMIAQRAVVVADRCRRGRRSPRPVRPPARPGPARSAPGGGVARHASLPPRCGWTRKSPAFGRLTTAWLNSPSNSMSENSPVLAIASMNGWTIIGRPRLSAGRSSLGAEPVRARRAGGDRRLDHQPLAAEAVARLVEVGIVSSASTASVGTVGDALASASSAR